MKRIVSFILTFVLLCGIMCAGAYADYDESAQEIVRFSLEPHQFNEGDAELVADLVVSIADGYDVTCFGVCIDSENLTLKNIESKMESGMHEGSYDYGVHPYKWLWVGATSYIEGDCTVAVLTFDVNGGAAVSGVEYRVTLSACDRAYVKSCGGEDFTRKDGGVAFGELVISPEAVKGPEWKLGDLDGDEDLNLSDVVIILRIIADWPDVSDHPEAGDVDRNGDVDIDDVVYYMRHLAGWGGYDITG